MSTHRTAAGAAALVLSLFSTSALAGTNKVTICHATSSATNPFVEITVSTKAWLSNKGHGGHARDSLAPTWFADGDGDGFGDASDSVESCDQPDGYVEDDTDCDDGDDAIYPGATEYCDDIDNDCNDEVDEGGTLINVDRTGVVALDLDDGVSSDVITLPSPWGSNNHSVAGLRYTDLIYSIDTGNQLYEVDLANDVTTVVGDITGYNGCGLAFGPDDRLYGLSRPTDELVEFDPLTGAVTVIGSLGYDVGVCGLTYSPEDGVFYAYQVESTTDARIYTVDPSSGAATSYVSLDNDVAWAGAGIAWSCEDDTNFIQDSRAGVFEVDMGTGAVTNIHSYGGNALSFTADW